jgi:hypothetical protein
VSGAGRFLEVPPRRHGGDPAAALNEISATKPVPSLGRREKKLIFFSDPTQVRGEGDVRLVWHA